MYLYAGKEKDSRAREIPVDGMNQNQILFFNITGANGTDARAERAAARSEAQKKEIHLKKSESQNKDTPKQ